MTVPPLDRGGAPAVNDLIAGHVKIGSLGSTPLIPHYKAGVLRLLAQSTATRSPSMPEVPTFQEAGIQGLVLDQSVEENLGLVTMRAATKGGLVDLKGQHEAAAGIAEKLGVRMAGLGQHVRTLSGGNQQKVVIGKWLLADTKVLILDEPTRGIDVGAKVEIYQLINELTAAGAAVLMISSDLPEVLGMSDRVLVMAQGRIAGELSADEATQDSVMALAVSTPTQATTAVEGHRGH